MRGFYQHRETGSNLKGYRHGTRKTNIDTPLGPISYDRPRVNGSNFESQFHVPYMKRPQEFASQICDMYINGVSTRKIKRTLKSVTGDKVKLSKSTVSRISKKLIVEFKEWKKRDLSNINVSYLFFDAIRVGMRLGGSTKDAVMIAYAILDDGSFAVLSIDIPSGATQVSVGGYHACAILKGGEVKCWGQNMMGQLGSRAAGNVLLPPDVAIERGATFVSSGHVHTCAVVAEALYCWGQNMWGQLGTGSNMPYMITTPTKVISSGVKMVAAGLAHTCVLMKTGSVQCWGRNEFGQVGDGSIETAYSPKGTTIKGDATSISVNNYTSCAIVSNKLKCWGRENQNFDVVNAPKDEAL